MSTSFPCPACGQTVPVQVPAGTQLRCPLCNTMITAPATPPTAGGPIVSPYGPGMTGPVRQGMAIAALVCGILGVVTCFPIFGIVGLVLGIVAVVKAGNRPSEYGGKGMAIAGICTGGVSLLIVVPLMLAITLPSLARARELAKRSVCAANMQHIATALLTYANDNREQFPPNLDILVTKGTLTPKHLLCPSAPQANYVYTVAGLTADAPPKTVVLYEPITNHEEGGNVIFLDGHVKFLKQPEYDKAIAGISPSPISQPGDPQRPRRPAPSRANRTTP